MQVLNIHERSIRTGLAEGEALRKTAAELLETLGTRRDKLWPRRRWPAMLLDADKAAGGRGGHGPVRYHCTEHAPGQKTVFQFDQQGLSRGLHGTHYFELEYASDSNTATLTGRHTIAARAGWPALFFWPLVIRPLHDALIEDALDQFERSLGQEPQQPNRYSLYVRALRKLLGL